MEFVAKKDLSKNTCSGWEDLEDIKKGDICKCGMFEGAMVIYHKGKAVCDLDSLMALEYFEKVK